MTHGKWFVTLNGEDFDLQKLSKFSNPPKIEIKLENGKYLLCSDKFNSLSEAREVVSVGKKILKIINGIAKLHFQNFGKIECDNPLFIDSEDKKHFFLLCEPAKFRLEFSDIKFKVSKADGTIITSNEPNYINSTIDLAVSDSNVEKALRIFGSQEQNWSNLYKIYEIIDGDVGGKSKITSNGWASSKKIEKFHNTANNSNSVGDDARHHNPHRPAPPKPMSIQEAKDFISDLLKRWIESKI